MLQMELEVETGLEIKSMRSEAQSLEINVANSDESHRLANVKVNNYNQHCRELSCKLGRILRLMKFTGTYYGDTSLTDDPAHVNSSCFCSHLYCAIVLLGQWTLLVQAVISLFYEGLAHMTTFYLLLIYVIFYLESASLTTISLFILPKRKKNSSNRFTRFTSNLLTIGADHNGGITLKSMNRLFASACLFAVFNSVSIVLIDAYGHVSVARYRPWNGLFHYRFLHSLFGAFDSCSWAFPFLLFCASSERLAGMFESLEKKILSKNSTSLNIGSLRQDHQKLCELVAMADEVFSPFLLATLILDTPLICINFHQLLKSPYSNGEGVTFVLSILYWCASTVAKLTIILKFGVRVNTKIHSFYDTLQKISVPDLKEHLELLHFLMHLRGEPIGLSVGGLVVIDKNFALSLVGIIISYFTVLISLPS